VRGSVVCVFSILLFVVFLKVITIDRWNQIFILIFGMYGALHKKYF